MDRVQDNPCTNNALACVAGCTDDGSVYVVSIDPLIFDVNLWVHSGVHETWRLLATLKLDSVPELDKRRCLMSPALSYDTKSVDVFLEAAESIGYLCRFFISNPEENCVYKCIDAEKINFATMFGPVLHWLGKDCLFVGGIPEVGSSFQMWRINLDKESKTFTSTDLVSGDLQAFTVCADEDFLYLFSIEPPGEIKLYVKSPEGTVEFDRVVKIPEPYSGYRGPAGICAFPTACGECLLAPDGKDCYLFDCKSQAVRLMFTFGGEGSDIYTIQYINQKWCTASSTQFFWLRAGGLIGKKALGVPSL